MIRSTPVRVSKARMLRPSRPIMRPFISSLGNSTTDTVVSAEWSAAQRWMAIVMISRARLSASSRASDSTVRIMSDASWRISCSILDSNRVRASSCASPATRSSSLCCFWTNSSARSFSLLRSASLRLSWSSRRSSCSIFLSSVSSFCRSLRSNRRTSERRSLMSRSASCRSLYTSSLASSIASRFFASDCFLASSTIAFATTSASPVAFSPTRLRYRYPPYAAAGIATNTMAITTNSILGSSSHKNLQKKTENPRSAQVYFTKSVATLWHHSSLQPVRCQYKCLLAPAGRYECPAPKSLCAIGVAG